MMGSSFKVVVLLLAALLGTSQADKCASVCPRSLPTSIVPKVESTYVYSLEAKTTLTPRDSQKVTIKADVELAVQSVCESSLRLTNVAIEGVEKGAELATQLSSNPLAFGYFNGKVRTVCPVKDEEEWAVNIKKAVVSALQVSVSGEESGSVTIDELDFSGKCPTTFRSTSSDGGITIEKKKDLNKCSDRRVDLRQSSDQALSQLKELIRHYLHPVDSQLSCKISVKDKVVKDVNCDETHTLVHRREKPIHVSNLKLSLKDTKTGIAADFAEREVKPQPIFLSHEQKTKNPTSEADVVALLKQLCQSVSDKTAHIESSSTFSKLSDLLKYLPNDAAASVDEAVKSGSICPSATIRLRELFLDASAFAASDSAIKTLVKAHNNKELSVSRAAAAFTIVALKASPNEETVNALLPVVESESSSRPILLGFSILIRRYCEKTKDCETNAALKNARDVYVNRIGKTTDKLVKVTLIKALENLNVNKNGNENAIKLLDEIINSQDAGNAARLAAVKALPDEQSINDQLKSIFLKETNPNEVRIAAFQKLAANNGIKDAKEFVSAQEHCVKNYVLSYLTNIKNSKNQVRRSVVPNLGDLEKPSTELGISKNLVYEYGPLQVEVDVVYPKDSNVTRSITASVNKVVDDKIVRVAEVSVRQEGLDKQVGNILNVISRKITPTQFSFEVIKDLTDLAAKLKKKEHEHNHLEVYAKVNGKNVLHSDAFEDLHTLVDLLRKRFEKIVTDKKVDRTIGSVLIDTKVAVPTITGIPLVYKLNDNAVLQINGEVQSEDKKKHFILNRSLVAGIQTSIKLKLKDQKLGYEYDAKLAFTPNIDVEVEKKEKGVLFQLNTKEDRVTLLKFKQSLKEIKKTGAADADSENELAAEARSDDCVSALILNYCRKSSHVKGLKIPNVEYYVTKPDPAITAIQVELTAETSDPTAKKVSIKVNSVGSATPREHLVQVDVINPKEGTKELKMLLKSPDNSFETKFALNLDQSRNLNVVLKLPNFIDVDLKAKFEKQPETNGVKNDIEVEYKFPGDAAAHTLKYQNSLSHNLKRSGKDKVANLDYSSKFESSRRPYLNHRSLIQFKYRPYKVNEIVLEFAYGKDFDNLYKFSRNSKIEVQDFRPFKMNSESELNLVATDFDVNYELKSDARVFSDKGKALELDFNVKGKDRSKRAAEGNNDIEGKFEYKNKGESIDSKLDASLKLRGREMGWNSELKQVEPSKYEGKITIQTDKDKKIFIVHKEEISKPTKEINIKSEADISYSDKPDKKTYKFEAKKQGTAYLLKGEAKKDGQVILSNDVTFESSTGNLKALLTRDYRSYDLTVDNVFKPKDATLVLKVKDRVYNIKFNREPLRFVNIKVDGNENALIKNGEAHLSVIDATKVNFVTKANSKVDLTLDLIAPINKKASLKIDSPKFNFVHQGDIDLQVVNGRILWKSSTKKDNKEYTINADLARKGSLIVMQKIVPERTSTLKYSRNGDKFNFELDTEFVTGKIEGDRKAGKVALKNVKKNYELESTYKYENGKFIVESTTGKDAKLEAVISRKEPSFLNIETPSTKAKTTMDLSSPIKTFKFVFDNPKHDEVVEASYEPKKKFKYSQVLKFKETGKEQISLVEGIPLKEINIDLNYPDFKFKVKQPEGAKKVEFSYTFNNYTENEEFEFNPNRAYLVNWISVLRQYAQTFIVQN